MKIKFKPGPIDDADLISIQVFGVSIRLWFFPVYCWTWEWEFIGSKVLKAFILETPAMTIKFNVLPKWFNLDITS